MEIQLKIPNRINEVSIIKDQIPTGSYPPIGFIPFFEGELGNGDYFGLYWPIGKEMNDPLVCDMIHDEARMAPRYSSLSVFLNLFNRINENEDNSLFSTPSLQEDNASPLANYAVGINNSKIGNLDVAIKHLEKAVDTLPEYSFAWMSLSQLYRRVQQFDKYVSALFSTATSLWSFGFPDDKLFESIKRIRDLPESLSRDPFLLRRDKFGFKYGGAKTNDDYDLYKECISEYYSMGQYLNGLKMQINYGFLMSSETLSFKERYEFDSNSFNQSINLKFIELLNVNRVYKPLDR